MRRILPSTVLVILLFPVLTLGRGGIAEPIYHEKFYPDGPGPFPAVIALHSSGGFKTIKHLIQRYVTDGFAVYVPDFFKRHGLTSRTRMDTFNKYRKPIENELTEIINIMKKDKNIKYDNIFSVGFSNGGFWVCYLTGTSQVNSGVSHYGVWKANLGREITNPYPMRYFSESSSPILALHGEDDGTQKMRFVEEAWDIVKGRGGKLAMHVYPEADHAWDKKHSRRWSYNEEVDKDSHKRTIKFFKTHMK